MRRGYGSQGNRLAPQRDDMESRRELEDERKKARREAMIRRLSSNGG